MSRLLDEAQVYQEEHAGLVPDSQRPAFHVSAPVGWINDPNGWSVYKGEYHLFFQYHPYDTHWGSMHWGHVITKDFVKWERLPVALAPDMEYDAQGCFSGSAVEHEGRHILLYTGVCEKTVNGRKEMIQAQCVATGDGVVYTKADKNPVITPQMLPEGCNIHDFRDPKIWRKDGVYYALIGSKNQDNDGQVVIFRSEDLRQWSYVSSLDRSEKKYGGMWECPDLFELDGKDVLITSPQFMEADGLEFHNGNGTLCIIGRIDEQYRMCRETLQAVDYGLDFYAPQTLKTADGRRVMIAWMQSWDNHITPEEFAWSGVMCFPRVLTLADGRLCQYPVYEIETYRRNHFVKSMTITEGETCSDLISGRQIDLILKLIRTDCSRFEISLACGRNKYTKVVYEPEKSLITFDRTHAGFHRDVICTRTMKVSPFHQNMEIRILMDKYTVELFADGGRYAMSSLIYTDLSCEGICFSADGETCFTVEKYDMEIS